ncbi:AraC family transcriptional regulator [Pedobacter nyackensis]|uniref:AraC family transcriptional regulator n=1 Tax=Pedobacter nyackensis TaxID=475255 RepID=UPI00292DC757|nr:AraC family transcriptional regulator [Pedobacter nyackensis]
MKPELIDVHPAGAKNVRIKQLDTHMLISSFHFHDMCELVWIEKSHGKRIVGDHIGDFEDNDLVFMGPDLPHIWQNDKSFLNSKEGAVKSTVIYFPANILTNLTDDQNVLSRTQDLIGRGGRGLKFTGETNEKVKEILLQLHHQNGFERIISVVRILEILSNSNEYSYLASIVFKNQYDEKDSNRINKVYQFLMENFQRDILLQEVADLCNMTTNSFCRFFKARSQKSLTQFINEIRIGHACKLLQNADYSITDVCFSSGYNNLTNFNKFFKEIKGMKPSEYRGKLKK